MVKPLDSRLKALESRLSPCPELLTFVRTVVYPDGTQAEVQSLRDEKGNKWQRQLDETDHAFVERVKTEAWRNEWGVIALVGL